MTTFAHGENGGQPPRWNVNVGLEDRRKLRNRLRRIEGQVRGLQRMVEEEAPCKDIITQLGSVVAAMEHVGLIVLVHQVEQHVRKPHPGEGSPEQLEELIRTVELLLRTDEEARVEQG